ncbi:MAG TPA: TRAP transporter large permease subunit, partial [Burkholderiales bacterium]|nr:TRAP transporter large permease subunit [Burkholderiales bacterium]
MNPHDARPYATGFASAGGAHRLLAGLLAVIEYFAAFVLAVDVLMVFASVIWRYFLHDPLNWAEEIARALMVTQVFLGAATAVGRAQHVGIDSFRTLFPVSWRPAMIQLCDWIIVAVSVALLFSSAAMLIDSRDQTTPIGLPQWMYIWPVVAGSLLMIVFGTAAALNGSGKTVWATLAASLALAFAVWVWNALVSTHAVTPAFLLVAGFGVSLVIGVPIAFALAFSSLLYFLVDPSLPMLVYSQQVLSGMDHFVLLAIPFFVLAGLIMEANGMSARLIELLLRMMGRLRGGLNLIMIAATAFFSGVSGSKLADIAAVGGIIMPAVRRTRQDPNDAAGLLASTAVMAETIPPCINMIILGFVANISIGGLFLAG